MARRQNQRGIALIMVLWVALFLSVLLAAALATARIEVKLARANLEDFKIEQASLGAMNYTVYALTENSRSSSAKSLPLKHTVGGYEIEVSQSAEGGKIDLNLASEESLADLFLKAGLDASDATAFAARIADWRDRDDLKRPNGAEKREYAAKSLKIGNRPFLAVSELEHVIDADKVLIDCLFPKITIYGLPVVNQNLSSYQPGQRASLKISVTDRPSSSKTISILFTGQRGSPANTILLKRGYTDTLNCS